MELYYSSTICNQKPHDSSGAIDISGKETEDASSLGSCSCGEARVSRGAGEAPKPKTYSTVSTSKEKKETVCCRGGLDWRAGAGESVKPNSMSMASKFDTIFNLGEILV